MKKTGILLPIFSLPNKYGIGTLGKNAYKFIDFLSDSKQDLWQILPTNPTSYGDSPYQSFSTFAGNPYYIDMEEFIEKGFLTREDCENAGFLQGAFVDKVHIQPDTYHANLEKCTRCNYIPPDPNKVKETPQSGASMYYGFKKSGVGYIAGRCRSSRIGQSPSCAFR